MKLKIYSICSFLFFCIHICFAQNHEGIIQYEKQINLHELYKDNEEIVARSPMYKASQFELFFNAEQSIFKPKFIDPNNAPQTHLRHNPNIRRYGNKKRNDAYFKNRSDNSYQESVNLQGKQFLVQGESEIIKWKITGEQKEVGSFQCIKAIYKDSITTLEAWFTPMIPVMDGPFNFTGLPGIILHLNIDNGNTIYTAKNIELKSLEEDIINAPTDGKSISRKKFEALKKEKKEEMDLERSGNTFKGRRRGH